MVSYSQSMVSQLPEHELHEAHDSEVFSYVQEYEAFDCNSLVFSEVLYSVRAHENCFSFITCGFVVTKL